MVSKIIFYKIITNESPSNIYRKIPKISTLYSTRKSKKLPPIKANHSFFKALYSIHHYRMEHAIE